MWRHLLASATALVLSAGGAFAASPGGLATTVAPAAPQAAASAYYGYYSSGYQFPDDGSPSGTQAMARPLPPQPRTGPYSHIWLYPPSEGADTNG